jgi:hypothetical protein
MQHCMNGCLVWGKYFFYPEENFLARQDLALYSSLCSIKFKLRNYPEELCLAFDLLVYLGEDIW